MSNEYETPGAPDDTGQKFAKAVKDSGIGKLGVAVAGAPLAMRNASDKVGKKIGKFGKKLGL